MPITYSLPTYSTRNLSVRPSVRTVPTVHPSTMSICSCGFGAPSFANNRWRWNLTAPAAGQLAQLGSRGRAAKSRGAGLGSRRRGRQGSCKSGQPGQPGAGQSSSRAGCLAACLAYFLAGLASWLPAYSPARPYARLCPSLSISVRICPCLSVSAGVCPHLSTCISVCMAACAYSI